MFECIWSSAINVAHYASCFVLLYSLKQKIGKNRCCCFQSRKPNDHLFGKELFIRFTVRVFREQLSILVFILSLLVLRVDVVFDCINS